MTTNVNVDAAAIDPTTTPTFAMAWFCLPVDADARSAADVQPVDPHLLLSELYSDCDASPKPVKTANPATVTAPDAQIAGSTHDGAPPDGATEDAGACVTVGATGGAAEAPNSIWTSPPDGTFTACF